MSKLSPDCDAGAASLRLTRGRRPPEKIDGRLPTGRRVLRPVGKAETAPESESAPDYSVSLICTHIYHLLHPLPFLMSKRKSIVVHRPNYYHRFTPIITVTIRYHQPAFIATHQFAPMVTMGRHRSVSFNADSPLPFNSDSHHHRSHHFPPALGGIR